MAVTRNQPIAKAPRESRIRLGELLFRRREELGFGDSRPRFYRATGVNRRYADDLENARRSNFDEPFLRMAARGYAVAYESVIDVAWGKADKLTPDAPSALPAGRDRLADGPDGWQPPVADKARRDADAPYAAPILTRLVKLADAGVIDPTGEQVFPGAPADAKAWDSDVGRRLPPPDRAWFIAIVHRWEAENSGRAGNSGTGA